MCIVWDAFVCCCRWHRARIVCEMLHFVATDVSTLHLPAPLPASIAHPTFATLNHPENVERFQAYTKHHAANNLFTALHQGFFGETTIPAALCTIQKVI